MRLANRLFLDGRLRESARMLSFLGELIGLMVWLFQQGSEVLRRMVGPAPDLWDRNYQLPRVTIGSCHSVWPATAARWLAVGPPWDRLLATLGETRRSESFVTVFIPSQRSSRR